MKEATGGGMGRYGTSLFIGAPDYRGADHAKVHRRGLRLGVPCVVPTLRLEADLPKIPVLLFRVAERPLARVPTGEDRHLAQIVIVIPLHAPLARVHPILKDKSLVLPYLANVCSDAAQQFGPDAQIANRSAAII